MNYCKNCCHSLSKDSNFCGNCGTAVNSNHSDNSQRKTVYEGELHKCPNCGELINSFMTICPACNYEFRGSRNSISLEQFAKKLELIEETRDSSKVSSTSNETFFGKYSEALRTSNPLLEKISDTDEKKINLIRSFSIPNSKEDIFEFMILAASNIDLKQYGSQRDPYPSQRAISDAWLAKFEQAYEKANISFSDTSDFLKIKEMYDKKMKQISLQKRNYVLFIIGCFSAMLFVPLIVLIIQWLATHLLS